MHALPTTHERHDAVIVAVTRYRALFLLLEYRRPFYRPYMPREACLKHLTLLALHPLDDTVRIQGLVLSSSDMRFAVPPIGHPSLVRPQNALLIIVCPVPVFVGEGETLNAVFFRNRGLSKGGILFETSTPEGIPDSPVAVSATKNNLGELKPGPAAVAG